jgi:hypothetical protein
LRPSNGPTFDLIAPVRPLQLYADGGYQLRFRSLEGTPNYGPRQILNLRFGYGSDLSALPFKRIEFKYE